MLNYLVNILGTFSHLVFQCLSHRLNIKCWFVSCFLPHVLDNKLPFLILLASLICLASRILLTTPLLESSLILCLSWTPLPLSSLFHVFVCLGGGLLRKGILSWIITWMQHDFNYLIRTWLIFLCAPSDLHVNDSTLRIFYNYILPHSLWLFLF